MAIDVWSTWCAEDIRRVLAAIEAAFEAAHYASGEANEEYQRGVRDTLYAAGRAFGVEDKEAHRVKADTRLGHRWAIAEY